MEPLKLGLIGLGGMGQNHLEKEKGLDSIHFVGVADVVPSLVDEVSRTYDVPGFYDPQQLIDSGSCEAILIATP
ncbi:MAG TPA: Gfo/Idh/MocA family oxidoreductase, partial [Chloroflexota bacterium]|nr:Gfo/Idh/MocA family oxidoreductase [Chloroflexota bacterium]